MFAVSIIFKLEMASSIITLTTDFGNRDGFVGTMKGVILGIFPEARMVDISHEIAPQNISEAAYVVFMSYKFFPAGTVHVVVVDPGVGSERRILCVSAGGYLFLAPDNGVLKYIFQECADARVFHITTRKYVLPQISQTFHGRDIFAPVAARLAKGLDPGELGPPISDYNKGRLPKLEESRRGITGEIIYVDRFGNVISNIPLSKLNGRDLRALKIQMKNCAICGLANSYSAGSRSEPIALIGSSGLLEMAVFMGSAQTVLGCELGDEVMIEFENGF